MMTGLLARLRGRSIDDRLLSGARASESDEAAARLEQLMGRRHRSRVAAGLRRVIEMARRSPDERWLGTLVPVRSSQVLESEPLILTLAEEIEQLEEVSPRGVILVSRLVQDGRSPLYASPYRADVEVAVKHARAALHLG